MWRRLITSCLFATGLLTSAHGQPAMDRFAAGKARWLNGDFQNALQILGDYRETDFGRAFEVDFMLGTSACRVGSYRDYGIAMLRWVAQTYADKLTSDGVAIVADELRSCISRQGQPPRLPNAFYRVVMAGARIQGKTFYWVDDDNAPILNYSARSRPIDPATIKQRWVPLGMKSSAENQASRALPLSKVQAFSRFVIASTSGHTASQIADLNSLLERFAEYYAQQFKIRFPENYVSVYLVPSIEKLQQFASRYHGMALSYGVIAYSFRDDLSIVAVIPGGEYGSLFHELFHLLARSTFGDIPTWLDEGAAALYEVSAIDSSGIHGIPNWRGPVLTKFRTRIPTLRELVVQRRVLDSGPDAGRSDDAEDQAIRAATARYFALYLQESGNLFGTYNALRTYSTSNKFSGTPDQVVGLIEASVGLGMDALNSEFLRWLDRVLSVPLQAGDDPRLRKYLPTRPTR